MQDEEEMFNFLDGKLKRVYNKNPLKRKWLKKAE